MNKTYSTTFIIFIFLSITLFFSCDNGEIERLNNRNQTLSRNIEELKRESSWLADKVSDLESELSSCKHDANQERIKRTELRIVAKMTPYGYTHVYGMQNAIDFLFDNYCTHFEYKVSRDQIERSYNHPIIIR